MPYLGTANRWDYLPVLRWFDVFGVRNKILDAVSRRDAFLRRLIDGERRRLDDGSESEIKSMIAVLLTMQKSEPEVYTDTVIIALCAVSASSTTIYHLSCLDKKLISRPFSQFLYL